MSSFQISLRSYTSEIFRDYPQGIDISRGYQVALKSFVVYNHIPNISPELCNNTLLLIEEETDEPAVVEDAEVFSSEVDDENNVTISMIPPSSSSSKKLVTQTHHESRCIVFDKGTYELHDIASVIELDKGHEIHQTSMAIDKIRMRVGMKSKWTMDFRANNSIAKILGFEAKLYHPSNDYIWSTNPVSLFSVQNIRIKTNLTSVNIHDTSMNDTTLYEFPLSVDSTEKIIERPSNPEYYTISGRRDLLNYLLVTIVDQDDRLVDFANEQIMLVLHFRPIVEYT